MSRYAPEEPIAAIATALAPSALAIVRVSGKNSIKLLSHIFSRPKTLIEAAGNTLVYGWIVDTHKKKSVCGQNSSSSGEKLDEVMVAVYRAPKSFTGEEMAEISCHGGTSPVLAVYNLLLQSGFRAAEHGEFTFRAFINGKTDLTRAEAVREIIDSKTDESRSRAAGRLAGAVYTELERIKKLLIETLADIEAEIEYPEDENAIADAFDPQKLLRAKDELTRLASTWDSEKLYQDGARIVLCGKTNAGKSSLFNMLLKEERAIVSDVHGTTRDWIESWISFSGIPARLFDTAGLRITADTIEQAGVERSHELAQEADLILYLVDTTEGLSDEDCATIQKFTSPVILVLNKIDKVASTEKISSKIASSTMLNCPQVRISSKTGAGIFELGEVVKAVLLDGTQTERTQAGLGSLRQKQSAHEALDSLVHAIQVPALNLPLDAVVQDIEDALSFLGEITGEVSPDDILESIFSRFCVGK